MVTQSKLRTGSLASVTSCVDSVSVHKLAKISPSTRLIHLYNATTRTNRDQWMNKRDCSRATARQSVHRGVLDRCIHRDTLDILPLRCCVRARRKRGYNFSTKVFQSVSKSVVRCRNRKEEKPLLVHHTQQGRDDTNARLKRDRLATPHRQAVTATTTKKQGKE